MEIGKYFKQKDLPYEILVVVDGSPDNTAEIARNYALHVDNIRDRQSGKSRKRIWVRQGLLAAKGEYRLFMDADGSTAITHLETFLPAITEEGNDVVIGSRDIEAHLCRCISLGTGKSWAIWAIGRFALSWDCGRIRIRSVDLKMLSARAAEAIASRMVVDRFGFDYELIILAHKLGFKGETIAGSMAQ